MDECVNFIEWQWHWQHYHPHQWWHHHDHDHLLRSFPTSCWSASWSPPPRSPPRTLLMPTAVGTGKPFFWTLVKFFFWVHCQVFFWAHFKFFTLADCQTKTILQGLGLLWLLLHNSVHSRDHVENVCLWCSSKGRIYAIARFEWLKNMMKISWFHCCCCFFIVTPLSKSFGHARGWSLPRVNHIQRQVSHLHLSIFDHLSFSISLPLFACPCHCPSLLVHVIDHLCLSIFDHLNLSIFDHLYSSIWPPLLVHFIAPLCLSIFDLPILTSPCLWSSLLVHLTIFTCPCPRRSPQRWSSVRLEDLACLSCPQTSASNSESQGPENCHSGGFR